jgi:CRP-like cAMP-binding protein/Fe-S-cluster-containing dehydrogenase component
MSQAQGANQNQEILSFLQKHVKIFHKSKEASLESLVKESKLIRFRANQAIVKQGEYGESFYVIISGAVSISVTSEEGKVTPIRDMAPGDFFGELAVMGQGLRTANVSAKDDNTVALEVHKIPFQKALKADHSLKDEMDKIFNSRVIGSFVRRLRYFQGVSDKLMNRMIDNAQIKTYKKNETIYKEKDFPDGYFLLKVGNVKLSRARSADGSFQEAKDVQLQDLQKMMKGGGEDLTTKPQSVVAYYNEGDFFGDVGAPLRPGTAWALGRVEVIKLRENDIQEIIKEFPSVAGHLSRSDTADAKQLENDGKPSEAGAKAPSKTMFVMIDDMMKGGMAQAESALVIYMDRCIRCGNCSRSCQARHGVSRMVRRGPTIRRRKKLEDTKKGHELILFPTSCRHCIDPECMIGCPTGAISRDRLGEVFIKDFCIACGNCARRCPYGNISIADGVPIVGQSGKTKRMAVKCDQCRDHSEASCVYNCPRGAIFRINPNEYFPEMKKIRDQF